MDLPILYQDEYLIVVDKPPGLVTTPAETIAGKETLADILERDFGIELDRGGLVHRLDKDTSGIVLAAKTQEAFENLQSQFASREVKKEYTALVHGFAPQKGEVVGAISRNPGNREKFIVLEGGKDASTQFETIERLAFSAERIVELFSDLTKPASRKLNALRYFDYTLLRCFPKTGRTHQIRVHLKHIGFPIVGDEKYAGRKTSRLDRRWCKRQFLHASKIEFTHPGSGQRVSFESPLPEDLKEALDRLEPTQLSS